MYSQKISCKRMIAQLLLSSDIHAAGPLQLSTPTVRAQSQSRLVFAAYVTCGCLKLPAGAVLRVLVNQSLTPDQNRQPSAGQFVPQACPQSLNAPTRHNLGMLPELARQCRCGSLLPDHQSSKHAPRLCTCSQATCKVSGIAQHAC